MGPANLLAHFIPASAMVGGSLGIKWSVPEKLQQVLRPSNLSASTHARYNADGFLIYSANHQTDECASYVQVFRNGCLEYGEGYITSAAALQGHIAKIPSKPLEKKLAEIFENGITWLNSNATEDPVYFCCSLIGVRGMRLSRHWTFDVSPTLSFDRQVIAIPEIQITDRKEARPYRSSLLPIVNSIWQANGYESTPFLADSGGQWDPFTF